MATITEQIASARQHGYTDAQIADHLASDPTIGPKVRAARQHGYDDAAILEHLLPTAPDPRIQAAADAGAATIAAHHQITMDAFGRFADSVSASAKRMADDWRTAFPDQKADPAGYAAAHDPSTIGNPGGERAAAVDRVTGADLVDLPLSVVRGAVRSVVPNMSDEDANIATVSGLTLLPVATGARGDIAAIRAAPPPPPSQLATNVAKFEAAGVRPTLAATGGPQAAAVGKFAAEDPIVGGRPQANLRASIGDTATAADRVASGYGSASSPQAAGQVIQRGVTRFAQDRDAADSFAARADQHYDRVFKGIPNGPVQLDATQAAMDSILGRVQAPTVGELTRSPIVQKLANAIHQDTGTISFTDLRALRTWVREAKGNPELRGNIGSADLSRIEGALTQDIYDNTTRLTNNPSWTRRLQQADRFYRAGMDRIDSSLSSSFEAPSPEAAYDRLVAAAQAGGRADVGKLLAVKRSLRPDEWGDVVATTVKRLGQPGPGAAPVAEGADAFSINNFVTNYNRLSPGGRAILFGSKGGGGAGATGLRVQLDNLAEVADMQKNIERAANSSRSAISGRGALTLAGAVNPHTLGPTIMALAGTRLLGEAMTSPAFVRWMVRTAKAPSTMAPARVTALTALAKTDPRIAAIAPAIAAQLQASQPQTEAPAR